MKQQQELSSDIPAGSSAPPLACSLMAAPHIAGALSQRDWNELVPVLREHGLLGRAADLLRTEGVWDSVPDGTRRHLEAAAALCEQHTLSVQWELERLEECLGEAGIPYTLLKGAAYLKAGLRAGRGRLFSDMDILVRPGQLEAAEAALAGHGWRSKRLNAYDERYYRHWMHQVPPLAHVRRGSAIDLHHAIVPPTSRLAFSAERVFALACPAAGASHAMLPDPRDLVLHSAVHALFEEDFTNALRDLSDIDLLIRELSWETGFAASLQGRARELGLEKPLATALTLTDHFFATPLEAPLRRIRSQKDQALSLRLLKMALDPGQPMARRRKRRVARALLYIRGHYLKMPLRLLLPHLTHKTFSREESRENAAA